MWGWFGFRNCGDDLLLINLINVIEKITSNMNKKIFVLGDEYNIKRLLPGRNITCKPRNIINFFKYAFKVDYFIIGPGGIFPHSNTKKLIAYYMHSLIMKVRKKRIVAIGLGIGIGLFQQKLDIKLLNLISSNYYKIVSRSKNFLSYPHNDKIILGADMVFLDKFTQRHYVKQEDNLIVVSLANVFLPGDEEWKEIFVLEILEFFKFVLNEGYRLNFIPFTNEIDKNLHDEICKRLDHVNAVSLPFSNNPYDTFTEMLKGEYSIVMRFHSLVMSLLNETPCISISYSDKSEDLMERFNLSKYSFRFGVNNHCYFNEKIMIDSTSLKSSFSLLIKDKQDVKKNICDYLPIIYKQSKINYDTLNQFFKNE